MIIWGVSAYSSEAAIVVFDTTDKKILFASLSERYSKSINDNTLNYGLIYDALKFGNPKKIIFYEDPILKGLKHFAAKDYKRLFTCSSLHKTRKVLNEYLNYKVDIDFVEHQQSHAGWAYLSPFDEAAILIVDSINSMETATIWKYSNNTLKKIWSIDYPDSLELFYSAYTEKIGYIPNLEEFMLMDISELGVPILTESIYKDLFNSDLKIKYNLSKGIKNTILSYKRYRDFDIASSVQRVFEEKILEYCKKAKELTGCKNIIFGGRSALNGLTNTKISYIFDNVWIVPNPVDSGAVIGAIANYIGEKIPFESLFVGYNIKEKYPIYAILKSLVHNNIALIANGKAEFYSKSLGNRTILGNPKLNRIVDKVNDIKKREKYRPFTVSILEDVFKEYFVVPENIHSSRYAEFSFKNNYKILYPGITSSSGMSKVHTVSNEDNPNLYNLLVEFYDRTGCPMLLNTGLNILGRPMLNDEIDIKNFERFHNYEIFWRENDDS